MKKTLALLITLLLTAVLFGCSSPAESTPPVDTDRAPADDGFLYSYRIAKVGAEKIDDENTFPLELSANDLHYIDLYRDEGTLESYRVFGKEFPLVYMRHMINFPRFPSEYGPLVLYSTRRTDSPYDSLTLLVRSSDNTPVMISGNREGSFQELDFTDNEGLIAFAEEFLAPFADLTGYTPSVTVAPSEEDGGPDGVCIEFNRTIDGCRSNSLVSLTLSGNKEHFNMILCQITDPFTPFLSAKIDKEKLHGVIDEKVNALLAHDAYELKSCKKEITLMVVDGTLKAYVRAVPEIYSRADGEKVACSPILMLIDLAALRD